MAPPPRHSPLVTAALVAAVVAAILLTIGLVVLAQSRLAVTHSTAPAAVVEPVPRGPSLADRAVKMTAPAAATTAAAASTPPPVPRWIWSSPQAADDERAWFRRSVIFTGGPPQRVVLRWSCDNHALVHANGAEVARSDEWESPHEIDLTEAARAGWVNLLVAAGNEGGPAAFVALLEIVGADGKRSWVPSDATWEACGDETFDRARAAVELGALGTGPWGDLSLTGGDVDRAIRVVSGFEADLVYTVPRSHGSWVSLTADAAGRLIAGAENGGLYRLTLAGGDDARAGAPLVEAIDLPIGAAQGLACAGGNLYCVVNGEHAEGPGFYRLRDSDGDDRYDEVRKLRAFAGGGEHGPHGVVQGPDGLLYVVGGNHVAIPEPERSLVPRVWDEDQLLPRMWDASGHAVGILAPGGWICRTDLEGRTWELVAIGFRNSYDLAFNQEGELFTFDSDMEWDMGAPWYRPTRVNHVTSGAEFGWRSGTGVWPGFYPDSLAAVIDIGPGSPTGIVFGYGAAFPQRYRDALFLLDWTYGTIYAVHLGEDGASYRATRETFLTGRPLPLTDAVVNASDGALYFAIGGRGVASAVYRVRYAGTDGASTSAAVRGEAPADAAAAAARERRHDLEAWHRPDAPPQAIDAVWPALGDRDRSIRFAARTALEHQPLERWAERALRERDMRTRLAALLALCRVGGTSWHDRLVEALSELQWNALGRDERFELLRCWALCFIRTGAPSASEAEAVARTFEAVYPCGDELVDRELCSLLAYLESAVVVPRTIALMEQPDRSAREEIAPELLARSDAYGEAILRMATAQPQRQQVHYALALRGVKRGWSNDLRERYFQWFDSARRTQGGVSFAGFLEAIRADALASLPPQDRGRYEQIGSGAAAAGIPPAFLPRGPGRAWTVEEVVALAADGLSHRTFERGRNLYTGAMCAQCHRFAGEGRMGGPDLTGVATRFGLREIIEALIEPSRVVSDQYSFEDLLLEDGSLRTGRVVSEDGTSLRLMGNLLDPQVTVEVPRFAVRSRSRSAISPMMPRLLDPLAPGEVLDLLAYLLSEGDGRSAMYTAPGAGEFRLLFDGGTLKEWGGGPGLWSVEGGEIVGHTRPDSPIAHNSFLIWKGELPPDFELRIEARLAGDNNSGIQYRARADETFRATGYQCDIHPHPPYLGMLYEEGGRGIVAEQGQRVRIGAGGDRTALAAAQSPLDFDASAWHEYAVIVRGNRLEHRIDGTVTCVVIDEAPAPPGLRGGQLALQLHTGAAYEVRFRNLRLRALGSVVQSDRKK